MTFEYISTNQIYKCRLLYFVLDFMGIKKTQKTKNQLKQASEKNMGPGSKAAEDIKAQEKAKTKESEETKVL